MRTKTKILTTVAAGVLAAGAFTASVAADDTPSDDVRQARQEMHVQMRGDIRAGMMSDDAWKSMRAMHDAIDPAAMEQMHDEMAELLPPELRDDAEDMHPWMLSAMTDGSGFGHASHHPAGR